MEDEIDGLIHVQHHMIGLHQLGVEAEVPVPVEHVLSDVLIG